VLGFTGALAAPFLCQAVWWKVEAHFPRMAETADLE
jgi:hypothetical protein